NKPVRIIVPFSAGSGSDVFARTLGPKFTETWGQNIVVENREGAGGAIGAQLVAKAAPDGYTLLLGATSWAVAPSLYAKPPYDAFRDFVPVGRIGSVPSVLVVHPTLPVNDVKALIKLAKAQPGKLDYSSSGKGAPSHLFVEYFKAMAKVDIVEVPYKITAQALTDVIGGQIVMNLPILAAGLPHVRAGRLKALAVTSAKRASAAPEIPTLAESGGLPGYEAAQWQGFIAPAGTPVDVVTKINAELNRALLLPDVKERIGNLGVDFAPTTPQQFAADIKTDVAKWDQLIKSLGIRLD
ncbi:MAG: tripartite tricarboxylate transporter substrate binding protein, partial [Betaproteobacteria bacterium]|nr:tripartite tricarboxylate transporter substrate binding protein [Betaproteobacteria bacterium]